MEDTAKPSPRKPQAPMDSSQDKAPVQQARRSATFRVGDPLEYRAARLFICADYFVRRGREIYTVAALDRATDLDVLAIRYSQPFRREVQIAECKSDGDRPLDRIFWLSGVQKFVAAERATLIRRSTKWNIKDFAKVAGVEVIDLPRLEELEKEAGVDTAFWPGISDREFFLKSEEEWNKALHRDEGLIELYLTLASEVRYQEPFGGVNYLLHQARTLTRSLKERRLPSESLGRFLLCDSISHLAMFFMRIVESSFALSAADRQGLIRKGLTYGHMDPKLTDRIFRNAYRIATETLKHYGKSDVRLDESFFKMPTPPNVSEIQEIIELLARQPRASTSFVPLTDLLLTEIYLKGRTPDWLGRTHPFSDIPERLRLVQNFIQILTRMGASPDNLESILFLPTGTAGKGQAPQPVPSQKNNGKIGPPEQAADPSAPMSLFAEPQRGPQKEKE